jgi:hypothetical protein
MKCPFNAGDVLLDREGKVTKVLVVDDDAGAVHVRFYEGEFADAAAVLAAIRAKKLEWSIGHAPMSAEAFEPELHTLVTNAPVTEDELEGYRYYVEATGAGAAPARPEAEGFFTKFWKMFGGST